MRLFDRQREKCIKLQRIYTENKNKTTEDRTAMRQKVYTYCCEFKFRNTTITSNVANDASQLSVWATYHERTEERKKRIKQVATENNSARVHKLYDYERRLESSQR